MLLGLYVKFSVFFVLLDIDVVISFWYLYTGFRWDRQWLVVNSNGRAYTQRVAPKLALVDVELPTDAFAEGWKPTNNSFMGKL